MGLAALGGLRDCPHFDPYEPRDGVGQREERGAVGEGNRRFVAAQALRTHKVAVPQAEVALQYE